MMNKELIERLARESGMQAEFWMTNPPKFGAMWSTMEGVHCFAALVAEECARLAEADANYVGEEGEQGFAMAAA